MKISYLMPSIRNGEMFWSAVANILGQGDENIELIIVNQLPGRKEIKHPLLKWIEASNIPFAKAWRMGYGAITGDAFCFASDDNLVVKEHSRIIRHFMTDGIDGLFSGFITLDYNNQYISSVFPQGPIRMDTYGAGKMRLHIDASAWRLSSIKRAGIDLRSDFPLTGDVAWIFDCMKAGFNLQALFTPLVFIRRDAGTISGQASTQAEKIEQRIAEYYRLIELFGKCEVLSQSIERFKYKLEKARGKA